MTLRPGDVVADRFEVCGDEEAVREARWALQGSPGARRQWGGAAPLPQDTAGGTIGTVHDPDRGEIEALTRPDLWLRGIDRRTGASVLIEPGEPIVRPADWRWKVEWEARARAAARAAPPFVVGLLHAGPGLVYPEPPPAAPRGTFTRAEAAELALQACEAAAGLHAAGITRLPFDPLNLRVSGTGGHARVHWLIPGVATRMMSHGSFLRAELAVEETLRDLFERRLAEGVSARVVIDMCGIIDFFFSLRSMRSLSPEDEAGEVALLNTLLGAGSPGPPSVAGLARRLSSLVPASAAVADRVAAIPVVTAAPALRFGLDEVIASGEAELSRWDSGRDFIEVPLAAAYHQRACRAWAAGDRSAALEDAERALSLDAQFLRYMNTRAVMLDGLGRSEEACRALDDVIPQLEKAYSLLEQEVVEMGAKAGQYTISSVLVVLGGDRTEMARTYAVRGAATLRLGRPAQAAADLRRAMTLHPCALHAHFLGAALRWLGDHEAPADAHGESPGSGTGSGETTAK